MEHRSLEEDPGLILHLSRVSFTMIVAACAWLSPGFPASAVWAVEGPGPATLASRPNIVFLLIDDLGWADLGCSGSRYYETPRIGQLAREGMRFTDAYAACPACSPTRAQTSRPKPFQSHALRRFHLLDGKSETGKSL